MARTQTETPKKKKPTKLTPARKAKIKKAQDAGGISNVAVSHTSKETILKKFRDEH